MSTQARWRAAFAVTVAVQLVVLYAPRAPSTGGVPGIDKVIHALVFGAVAFTALASGFAPPWVIGLLVVHAGVSEVLQSTVLPHRDGEVLDAAADCIGVALGSMLAVRRQASPWLRR